MMDPVQCCKFTLKWKPQKNKIKKATYFAISSGFTSVPFCVIIWHSKASKLRWKKKIRLGRSSATIYQWSSRQSSLGWWSLTVRCASVAGSSFDSCGTPACFDQSCASPILLCGTAESSCRISALCFAGRWDPGPALWRPCHFWCPGFPAGCFHADPSARGKSYRVFCHHSI